MLCSKTEVKVTHSPKTEYNIDSAVYIASPCTNSFLAVEFSGDNAEEEAELYAEFVRMRVAMIKEEND